MAVIAGMRQLSCTQLHTLAQAMPYRPEYVGVKLIDRGAHRAQGVFFGLMKVVIAAGNRRVFDAVRFERIFEHAADAHRLGKKKDFLTGFFLAADAGKKLVQIVEHLDHARVSLVLILGAKTAAPHLAVGSEKDRRIKKERQVGVVARFQVKIDLCAADHRLERRNIDFF